MKNYPISFKVKGKDYKGKVKASSLAEIKDKFLKSLFFKIEDKAPPSLFTSDEHELLNELLDKRLRDIKFQLEMNNGISLDPILDALIKEYPEKEASFRRDSDFFKIEFGAERAAAKEQLENLKSKILKLQSK